jgi:sulfite dehydrogenase (cytochrome) subunit B
MKKFKVHMVCLGASLSLAAGVAAQQRTIALPPDNPMSQLKTGAGGDTVRANCGVCHSTDYIVRQPHLDAPHWEGEVKKMVSVFGAYISDSDIKVIVDYLAKNYGPEDTTQKARTDKK